MNETGNHIIQQLFDEPSLATVSRREIEQLAEKCPYFGPAQFLLAKKLKETNGSGSELQIQKAVLYFSNPYWFSYQLHQEALSTENTDWQIAPAGQTIPETASIEETTVPESELPPIPESTATEPLHADNPEAITRAETGIAEINTENPLVVTQEFKGEEEPAVQQNPIEATQNNYPESEPATTTTDEIIIDEEDEQESYNKEDDDDIHRMKLSSLIEQHLSEFKRPVQEGEDLPVQSNPYHTIDYFASQGIKAEGQDKLAVRVRKFTDWLKQMKVAAPHQQPGDLGTDTETEHIIETIAQSSNETKDIITETMAEVLVKQGKTEKAIKLYKKLSFLNPAKSTYFAAKIEELNNK